MSEPANAKSSSGSAVTGFGLGCALNLAILNFLGFVADHHISVPSGPAFFLAPLVVIIPLAVFLWRNGKTRTVAGLISAEGIALLLMSLCIGLLHNAFH
jgi:hypothetical protein